MTALVALGAAALLHAVHAADPPRYIDLDLLQRVQIVAVAGSAAGSTGEAADEATETARQFVRHLAEARRIRVVDAERVAAAMAKLELRTPRDLFKRGSGAGLKLDVGKASRLARGAGADSLLIPIWDSAPPSGKAAQGETPSTLRMHVMLVYRPRGQIIWEDSQLVGTPPEPGAGGVAAVADRVAAPLVRRFVAQWRTAGERG
jgi:hypothetical protein